MGEKIKLKRVYTFLIGYNSICKTYLPLLYLLCYTLVAQNINVPLIVGGGIRDAEKAYLNCKAGADVIVVGNAIEKESSLIKEMATAIHSDPVKV